MDGLTDCNPNSARRMIIRALPELPALIWFAPLFALGVYLTCAM